MYGIRLGGLAKDWVRERSILSTYGASPSRAVQTSGRLALAGD
ncbi:MAG: hypothetical protein OXI05_01825 [Bacteroidota bacterium]|nr:hypothetical protein [Bacteroidota bacterium]MDE2644564.1 hypothetical protein [Bacteroidota bacterium]